MNEEAQLIDVALHRDSRGTFAKPFSDPAPMFRIREIFWSTSARGVVRGFHFQLPPAALHKLVWVSSGSVLDVVVDLRGGTSFGAVQTFELDAAIGTAVWVPPGFAHGFQSLQDDSIVNYATDVEYVPELDTGVRWDSVKVAWPLPVTQLSPRDTSFPPLADFASPFGRGQ